MIIRDRSGKVLGSIEFSKEELELDNEKFTKIAELGNKMFDNEKTKMETTVRGKEENTKRIDKITSTLSNTLHEVADLVKDFNKCEFYDPNEWDEKYNDFDPIDPENDQTEKN